MRLLLAICCLWVVTPAAHCLAESDPFGGDVTAPGGVWRVAIGPVAGALGFDDGLANYRWDTGPAFQLGIQAMLYRNRLGAGVRLWRAQTTQASGIPGEQQAPRVSLTGVDIVGQFRVIEHYGIELWGMAHGGVLHLGYNPDRLMFDTGGIGGPITVDYDPITDWDVGVGVEARGELSRHVAVSLQAERSTFALDTAHRVGGEIVESRERFYGWSLRAQLTWWTRL